VALLEEKRAAVAGCSGGSGISQSHRSSRKTSTTAEEEGQSVEAVRSRLVFLGKSEKPFDGFGLTKHLFLPHPVKPAIPP
jgi:hypothetical protein